MFLAKGKGERDEGGKRKEEEGGERSHGRDTIYCNICGDSYSIRS